MERLMTLPCYREGKAELLVRLRANYRSQPRILELSASLFYNNDLHPAAKPEEVESLTSWRELPTVRPTAKRACEAGAGGQCGRETALTGAAAQRLAASDLVGGALQQTPFPLLFFGVDGDCERQDESQAVYNVAEAVAVRDLILRLLTEADLFVSAGDFGVLAPYRKQASSLSCGCKRGRLAVPLMLLA
jgi:superfamily I DNA and/or RNA helicase